MDHRQQDYEQGYRSTLTREEKRAFRQLYCEKSTWKGLMHTFANLSFIYLVMGVSYLAIDRIDSSLAAAGIVLIGLLVITRQMRALENIVHFGSHNNFCRDRMLNDRMTNVLAAWPMLQDVEQYRAVHNAHHGDYGSHEDPCRERLERIGACGLEINNNRQLMYAILIWMPAYVREFYNEVKSSTIQLRVFLIWHAVALAMLGLLLSWQFAAFVGLSWAVSMFLILPYLRSIAEFSEHDYQRGDTVCDTTFNNLGLLDHLLLHPAGDAWHALHHLHPTVPWWMQGAAYRYLMKWDSAYRKVQNRDGLIQNIANFPVAASQAKAAGKAKKAGPADQPDDAYPSTMIMTTVK